VVEEVWDVKKLQEIYKIWLAVFWRLVGGKTYNAPGDLTRFCLLG
jgi:hypothetical protein